MTEMAASIVEKPPVVCVFCGSSPGTSPLHMEAARSLAAAMHAKGIKLVYGAGTSGIMGEVARSLVALSGPGAVHGIIPNALVKYERDNGQTPVLSDEAHYGRTTVVPDMHTRKGLMTKEVVEGGEGSGFVALSGGYGTMEELMEVTTWNQLGIHSRPIVVYNVDGYYDGLLQWIRKAVSSGFVLAQNENIIVEAKTPEEVIHALENYQVSKGQFKLDWEEK